MVMDAYNIAYHSGIKCSPQEAWFDYSGIARLENSEKGKYNKKFTKKKPERFKEGQQVRIAKQENLKLDTKDAKGRFLDMGVIIGK
ncbi:hypothetical protein COBT_004254, partial [Conglomerata obtusa]